MPKLKDLEPGDIIMTMVGGKAPALHTQIYTDTTHFPATIIHAVDDGHRKLHKVMPTSIKGSPDYRVYRCKNATLCVEAAVQAFKWARYETPYDQHRKLVREGFRSQLAMAEKDAVAEVRKLFETKGKFRAIKYAARRDGPLCHPKEDGTDGRGVNCAMFVLLCYQSAALRPHVHTPQIMYPNHKMVRVSDKKIDPGEIEVLKRMKGVDATDFEQYLDYTSGLHSDNEFKIDWDLICKDKPVKASEAKRWIGYIYVPSLLAWASSTPVSRFPFDKEMSPGLMLDAKVVTSEQLRLSLAADKLNWEDVGALEDEASPVDPNYKSKLVEHGNKATELKNAHRRIDPPRTTVKPVNMNVK